MTASAKPPAALKKRKLSTKQWLQPNVAFGQRNETRAQTFLLSKGYVILHTNVWFPVGEIDIIAIDPIKNELVFCEVKSRTTARFGPPTASINWKKLLSMRKAASSYLSVHPTTLDIRFDVIALLPQSIQHYENVTAQ